jgi:hypothetical protein
MLMFRSTHERLLAAALADRDDWKHLADARLVKAETAEQLHALTRDRYDRLWADHTAAIAAHAARYETLALQVVELKRAEAGLPPMAFDASLLDPMNSLGLKTQLAIDDFAGGDPEMKKYLVGRAHLEWSALRGQMGDLEEIDKEVAEKVRRGDQ